MFLLENITFHTGFKHFLPAERNDNCREIRKKTKDCITIPMFLNAAKNFHRVLCEGTLGLTFWVTHFCKNCLLTQSGLKTSQPESRLRPPFDSGIKWRLFLSHFKYRCVLGGDEPEFDNKGSKHYDIIILLWAHF